MIRSILLVLLAIGFQGGTVLSQQEIGFVEEFALAKDRTQALRELIPGTEEFYRYTCLHQQNEGQLEAAAATLRTWRQRFPRSNQTKQFELRQLLLDYENNPGRTAEELRKHLGLNLNHTPPRRDPSADLPSKLNPSAIELNKLLQRSAQTYPDLGQITDSGVVLLAQEKVPDSSLRSIVARLPRANFDGAIELVARELQMQGSRGFGALPVHSQLTLEQLRELEKRVQGLKNDQRYIDEVLLRLRPAEYVRLEDPSVLEEYLERCYEFTQGLGDAHNSLKALVASNLLKLRAAAGRYDKQLFIEFLQLPHQAAYYSQVRLRRARYKVDAGFNAKTLLIRPIEDSAALVREHLEHFLAPANDSSEFAAYIEDGFLKKVLAESKILAGAPGGESWYASLSPAEQKSLRERVELTFAPGNKIHYSPEDDVRLRLRCKNVDELLVNVYQVSLRNYYRSSSQKLATDIDLDGLVPHISRRVEFDEPADRRHVHTLDIPEIEGRGVWVVDLLGGGVRSRALVRKGDYLLLERMTDAGQQFAVLDESARLLADATLTLSETTYEADSEGWIQIPFAERDTTRHVLLEHNGFIDRETIRHASENYRLAANFVVDEESLISGATAPLMVATRLTCNEQPVASELLEGVQLTITATNLDGVSTSETVRDVELADIGVLRHEFVVPQRLSTLKFELKARIRKVASGKAVELSASDQVVCNAIAKSDVIYDPFLLLRDDGYHVRVAGRNGEPGQNIKLSIGITRLELRQPHDVQLATDARGEIALGHLSGVQKISVRGDQIQDQHFDLLKPQRMWPSRLHLGENDTAELALGAEEAELSDFALLEQRGRRNYLDVSDTLQISDGALRLKGLESGDFVLHDYKSGQSLQVAVQSGQTAEDRIIGSARVIERSNLQPVVLTSVETTDGGVALAVGGATDATRVHVVARSFVPGSSTAATFRFAAPNPLMRTRPFGPSYFIDSLRLDEEYQYILRRREAEKFPGNLLARPSILLNPWDIAVTENERLDAKLGDDLAAAAPMAAEAEGRAEKQARKRRRATVEGWKSYESLLHTSLVLTNLRVENGRVQIPADQLEGYGNVSVFVVNPDSIDSRHIVLDDPKIEFADVRLQSAFDSETHLGQSREVRSLASGESVNLSSGVSQQFQSYETVGALYGLLSTIVDDPQLAEFAPLTGWRNLPEDEKRSLFSRLECHELNFFLYCKDRDFFDEVVAPFLKQKVEKQFLDRWLLDMPVEDYLQLNKFSQLNTFEKVLLGKKLPEARQRADQWLGNQLVQDKQQVTIEAARFESAMLGRALSFDSDTDGIVRGRGGSNADPFAAPARAPRSAGRTQAAAGGYGGMGGGAYFGRARGLERAPQLFETLPKTKKWAETNYHRIRIGEQSQDLVAARQFWLDYLNHEGGPFLPSTIHTVATNRTEALLALAVVDLPMQAEALKVERTDDGLTATAQQPQLLVRKTIRELEQAADGRPNLLVGHEYFVPDSIKFLGEDQPARPAFSDNEFIKGTVYGGRVVVSNPTNQNVQADLLYQLPAGSVPLSAAQHTTTKLFQLGPYATQQFAVHFYFPAEGEFSHYGAQISESGSLLASSPGGEIRAVAEPSQIDKDTWDYIAKWADIADVTSYLESANLAELDLGLIAFRMSEADAFEAITGVLRAAGHYAPQLWAYAVKHQDTTALGELVAMSGLAGQVGPAIRSPLLSTNVVERLEFEHLDFRPLVVPRAHQLGANRVILNAQLSEQYHALLELLAYQDVISPVQRMQLCYYLLLQNRIPEAIDWFKSVEVTDFSGTMQYDYFDAYLSLYAQQYGRAAEIAGRYSDHPVTAWRDMFSAIRSQIQTRQSLLAGNAESASEQIASNRDSSPYRRQALDVDASKAPVLHLEKKDGSLHLSGERLREPVLVNYYEIDVELLFSRRPFAALADSQPPSIAANRSQKLDELSDDGTVDTRLELPQEITNRNLIVEATSGGLSSSVVCTAGQIEVDVVTGYGQIRSRVRESREPLVGAYVKVYARHKDGKVRFYKDGYTDLRGYFDYASLSTSDLDTATRFAILVLDDKRGAVIREATPPVR